MRVKGLEDIYSVGDIANFPVKQAFLAFLQADAAAEHLKSVILDQEPEFYFESVSMCIMEQFDKATFAQVPVKISSNPDIPVEIDEEKNGLYRVGSGKIWRLGKKMLGMYLPLRFKYGNPFHAGIPWKIMEKGVEIMSKIFASL
jgi:sulfide:quinone oxidoreductase